MSAPRLLDFLRTRGMLKVRENERDGRRQNAQQVKFFRGRLLPPTCGPQSKPIPPLESVECQKNAAVGALTLLSSTRKSFEIEKRRTTVGGEASRKGEEQNKFREPEKKQARRGPRAREIGSGLI